jgi:hypothetical protein
MTNEELIEKWRLGGYRKGRERNIITSPIYNLKTARVRRLMKNTNNEKRGLAFEK